MDSHGVHVFDEADRDHPVLGVPDDLQLQFLPAQHGFLDKDLPDEAGGDAAARHGPQLLHVVNEAAARSAHRVGRTDHHRIAECCGDLLRLLDAVGRFAFGHVDAEAVHRCLEGDSVLAPLDGIDLNTNHSDSVFVQYPGLVQFGGQVEPRLAAEIRKDRVGAFVFDNLREGLGIQWFNIGHIGRTRIGHDRCRVGVDKDDLVAQLAQCFAGLGAGVVELAGLSDDNRA